MFEITYEDFGPFVKHMREGTVYADGVYDFTFEHRFLIYHTGFRAPWIYYALDQNTGRSSEVRRTDRKQLREDYLGMMPDVLRSIRYTGDHTHRISTCTDPDAMIDAIFRVILPQYGYIVRETQVTLCKQMYHDLTGKQMALSEAEVGTGKTLAYLIAGTMARYRDRNAQSATHPVTVATSSIALQEEIVKNTIPRLSEMLMNFGVLPGPLHATLRKGKEHYFCPERLNAWKREAGGKESSFRELVPLELEKRLRATALDLDEWQIPETVRSRIRVQHTCKGCDCQRWCRYHRFLLKERNNPDVDFQITNHSLFLSHCRSKERDRDPILEPSRYIILDEAHHLCNSAQSVFGEKLSQETVPMFLQLIREHYPAALGQTALQKCAADAEDWNRILFTHVASVSSGNPEETYLEINPVLRSMLMGLGESLLTLETLLLRIPSYRPSLATAMIRTVMLLRHTEDHLLFGKEENGQWMLESYPEDVGELMHQYVWKHGQYLLTSGTMTDHDGFWYFRRKLGIYPGEPSRYAEHTCGSPYSLKAQARLYLSEGMPFPEEQQEGYFPAVAEKIIRLVRLSHGHTVVLCTSYTMVEELFRRTREQLQSYPLFCLTREDSSAIRNYQNSGNGVLFACGPVWEGLNFSGDLLSSLILVRLPYPVRSPFLEKRKEQYDTVSAFVQAEALPEMLIRLRQGVGRLIRSEQDSGIVTILDSRAGSGCTGAAVRKVLREYPEISSEQEFAAFLHQVKEPVFFERGGESDECLAEQTDSADAGGTVLSGGKPGRINPYGRGSGSDPAGSPRNGHRRGRHRRHPDAVGQRQVSVSDSGRGCLPQADGK